MAAWSYQCNNRIFHSQLYLSRSLFVSLSICISIFTWDFFSALKLDRYIDSAPSRQAPCCLIHIHLLCCAVAFPLVIPSICIVSLPQNTLPPCVCVCVCVSILSRPQSSSKLAYPLLYYISFSFWPTDHFFAVTLYVCVCVNSPSPLHVCVCVS